MSYTIANFSDGLAREMHGRSTNRLQDVYETAYEAAQILLAELDPKETERTVQITPQLFDNVDAYSSPQDFKAALDLYPSGGRQSGFEYEDDFRRTDQREYSQRRSFEAPLMSESWVNGTRFLLLRKYPRTGNVITLDSLDDDSGWTAGGDAGSLAENTLNFLEGSAALQVTLTYSTGTGYIEKTTLTSQDLTDFRLLGACFYKVFIPSGFSARFSSFNLRWGNDTSTQYWNKSVTAAHDGTAFKDGWNILRFDWSSATETATAVDETAMDSARLSAVITSGSDIPGVLFDDLNIQLGTMYDLRYYSNFLFRNTSGTWLEKPTATDDIVNLSTDLYSTFKDIGAMCAMSEISSMDKDYEKIQKRLGYPYDERDPFKGSIGRYRRMYPSQRPTQTHILHDFGV